jgi:hypothetical protein
VLDQGSLLEMYDSVKEEETINNHIVICNQAYDPYRVINRITIYEINTVSTEIYRVS